MSRIGDTAAPSIVTTIATVAIALGTLIAPAATAAPASVTTQSSAARTPACVQAIAAYKKAVKNYRAIKATGTTAQIATAKKKVVKAKKIRVRACGTTTGGTSTGTQATTFSGNPHDPRPVGWTKPAAGSGLVGANTDQAVVTGCPDDFVIFDPRAFVTTLASGHRVFVVGVGLGNWGTSPIRYHLEMDAVDADGNPLNRNLPGGRVGQWPGTVTIVNDEATLPAHVWDGTVAANVEVSEDVNPSAVTITGIRVTCSR